ncbi:MAG: sigma-70 family RNA polymerase sigma factor, partial [Calditrichia bacterium]|nr:sigma-70 family RNA polymerase sigma factor [Calditrichia bacterium]
VADTQKISGRHLSMDAPFSNSEDNRLLDVIQNDYLPPPDDDLMDESLRVEIDLALATLTRREAEVVKLYFGLGQRHPLKLEEIGERFNLTRERIRQIKEKAFQRLRHVSRSGALRKFLG